MSSSHAQTAFMAILVIGVGAAVFRVATAPDRIRDRKETARSVCLSSGGQWVKVEREEICRKPGDPGQGG